MSDTTLGVSTCDRDPQYIHRTLQSLFSKDEATKGRSVSLVVCGPDAAYLDPYNNVDAVHVVAMTDEQWAFAKGRTIKHRCTFNFLRVLREADDGAPFIAMEDDVSFATDWLSRTEEIASMVTRDLGVENFILSLYASYRFPTKPYNVYNPCDFYGAQALYMTAKIVRDLRAFIQQETDSNRYIPADMFVKQFLLTTSNLLFVANPNLVQHVGHTSAIEQRFHCSPSFEE
jgi:hypothetical protein